MDEPEVVYVPMSEEERLHRWKDGFAQRLIRANQPVCKNPRSKKELREDIERELKKIGYTS